MSVCLNYPMGGCGRHWRRFAKLYWGNRHHPRLTNTQGEGLPFYQGKLEFGGTYPTPRKWCTAPKKIAETGDILISVRAPVGPTNICPEKSCVGRGLAAIRGLGGIEPLFILYLMRTFEDEIAGKGTGTTFDAITGNQLKTFVIPLPPLPEQHRIVAKIEELFTKLDAGIDALHKVQSQLKRYRQSVLKAAFEGKLTEAWRAEHRDEIEPASPVASDLPDGWVWTIVGSIGTIASGQTPKGINDSNSKGHIPFFKISDMNKPGNEKFMRNSEIALDDDEIKRLGIHVRERGTVIFPKRGGAIATNKKRILTCPSAYDLNIMGVLPHNVSTEFLYYWFLSIDLAQLSDGSNVPQLNHKDIHPLSFPLPPCGEQEAIVSEVERRLSVADKVEKTVTAELKRAEQLRQSILKQAFSGRLVPQDPNDEPASVLLERIRAEKSSRVIGH